MDLDAQLKKAEAEKQLLLVKQKALEELQEELFREEVELYKKQLRERRSLWDRLFPYKIVFVKKERLNGQ